jgi:WD40 repeat protein
MDSLIITSATGISIRPVKFGGSHRTSDEVFIGEARNIWIPKACFGADLTRSGLLAVAADNHLLLFDLNQSEPTPLELDCSPGTKYVDISADPNPGDPDSGINPIEDQWLAAGTDNGNEVKVWNLLRKGPKQEVTANLVKTLPVAGPCKVVFSSRSRHLVTATGEKYTFWDTETWDEIRSFVSDHGEHTGSICFSERGTVFILSQGNFIKVYQQNTFEELTRPEFDTQEPTAVSPFGILLLTSDRYMHLQLWNFPELRQKLAEYDLDLNLPPFASKVPIFPLVESVTVAP